MDSQDIRRRGRDVVHSRDQSTGDGESDEELPYTKKSKKETQATTSLLKKIILVVLLLIFTLFLIFSVIAPLVFSSSLTVRNAFLFMNWMNFPLFRNLSDPEGEFGLNCTRNLYIQTNDIILGTWHILPGSRISECNSNSEKKIDKNTAFSDDEHIILYLHGNGGARGARHRLGLYQVLAYNKLLNYHIVTFDYRGYGDSTSSTPSAQGLISDATNVYEWILSQVKGNTQRITVWGHSLGTAVAVHMISSLPPSRQPSSLVLESPFSSLADAIRDHPIASIFTMHPFFEKFFVEPIMTPETNFDSVSKIKDVKSPLLILHAMDDNIIPYAQGVKLFEAAMKSRDTVTPAPKMISFDSSRKYAHKAIYKDPQLPNKILEFISTYKSARKQFKSSENVVR